VEDRFFGSHELRVDDEDHETSSDRSFGLVFAGFCGIVGIAGLLKSSPHWPYWIAAAAIFAVLALAAPRLLAPLNKLWTKLGLLLYSVIGPVALGLLFFGCITPIGYLMRWSGRDPLQLRFDAAAPTYWVDRDDTAPQSFKNQF